MSAKTKANPAELITSEEAAKIIGISINRLRNYVSDGRVEVARKIGTCNLYEKSKIEEFKNKPRRTGNPAWLALKENAKKNPKKPTKKKPTKAKS